GGAPAYEQVVLSFSDAAGATSITFDGAIIEIGSEDSGTAVASAFTGATFTNWDVIAAAGDTVTLRAKTAAETPDLTAADFVASGSTTVSLANTVGVVDGAAAATEVVELAFTGSY